MEFTTLGNTDLLASRIGLGCELLGGTDWGVVDEKQAIMAVCRAVELGINVFDTADVYGLGRSEEVLSRALGSRRHEMIIVSKCGINWRPSSTGNRVKTFRDCSANHIMTSVEGSLRRLRLESIPVYLLHWPDPTTPIEESVEALMKCQREGKIRYFGFSNFGIDLLAQVGSSLKSVVIETSLNLISSSPRLDVIPYADKAGWGVLCYGALAQGALTGKYSIDSKFSETDRRHRLGHFATEAWKTNEKAVSRLRRMASRKAATIPQVAVAWVLSQPGVSVAVVGARTPEQVECNAAAADLFLDQCDVQMLEESSSRTEDFGNQCEPDKGAE